MKNIAVVGSGFTGSIIANRLAMKGFNVSVFEERSHVAGNCYTFVDKETNILVHKYGPHIFHTNNEKVWSFITRYGEFYPYVNRVKAKSGGRVFSMPINLHTINQYFNTSFSPDEAKKFLSAKATLLSGQQQNFEERGIEILGKELYYAFFHFYTIKQWGVDPKHLPASILNRLPVRFDYNDNYFSHKYQGIPLNGYTPIIEKLLDHERINLNLNFKFTRSMSSDYEHIFYSGPIDSWFEYELGNLEYRTLDFVEERFSGDYQGCAVMNYCDDAEAFTRITEHKHFSPWVKHEESIIYKEYSRPCEDGDIPYYPLRLVNDKKLLCDYVDRAIKEKGVSFVGRLGTYRYLDMDVCIEEALSISDLYLKNSLSNVEIPVFFNSPL